MDFERIDPMTNKPASKAQAMTAKEAAAVADRAAAGFEAWSQLGPSARRATLAKAAASLEARKDQFVAAMMSEVGATAGWAMFNLMLAAGMVREAAALTTQIAGEVIPVEEIVAELNRLKSAELLRGFRGSPALDIGAAAQIVEKVGALLMAEPRIWEIDLNPVIVYPRGSGALALDALIVAGAQESASTATCRRQRSSSRDEV
jgi:hypothetical protein